MSQNKLAERIGVPQGQLNHWLLKKRMPSAQSLKLISEKTGISLDRLLEDVPPTDRS